MSAPEFSPAGYRALIAAFGARGYATRGFADADPAARHLILRHDVDFSLAAALDMAEAEAEQGIEASYFILLRTEFYNPLSGEGLKALERIAARHTVGLHFDAELYGGDPGALDGAVARECDLLGQVIGRPVELVSYHRPGALRGREAERLGGRINVYAPRFVTAMGYCSDSRGGWHYGPPLDHAAVRAGRALHLLVHPFWWQAPPLAPEERLRRFLAERGTFLDRELARGTVRFTRLVDDRCLAINSRSAEREAMRPDVLVTGAQGLLGGAIVRALREQGFDVLATGRRALPQGTAADGYRECELADAPSVERLFAARPKAVVHAAGRIQGSGYAPFARDNVLATATIADASRAAGVRMCVIISSIAVYSGEGPFTEDSPAAATDPYGWSKRAAECVGLAGCDSAVVLRLGGLHGRPRTGGVVDTFFTRAVRGETIEVDEPDTRVTLTFIDDVAAAIAQLLRAENAPPSRIYNLATREAPSYGELAECVRSTVSNSSAIRTARNPKRRNRVLDTGLIRSELRFAPLPLEEHLGRFARAIGSSRV